jgi:ATP/maltotriose-dependent transcriptional regulator MalT
MPLLALAARVEADAAERSRAKRWSTAEKAALLAAERIRDAAESVPDVEALPQGMRAERVEVRAETARAFGLADVELWKEAGDIWARSSQPYRFAIARYRLAEAILRTGGKRSAARDALKEAGGIAQSLSAAPLQQRIGRLARRARLVIDQLAEGPGSKPPMPAGLSRREIDVLLLVADGLTNRRIAEMLFVSDATVATHVSHILGKLGVRSRLEAAEVATHLDLS